MSSAIHIIPPATPPTPIPGCPYTRRSLCRSQFIRIAAGSSSQPIAFYRTRSQIQVAYLRCPPRKVLLVCVASSSGQRSNQDFSRQNNKQGFFRRRSRQNGERYNFENLEEPEPVSSKNGSLSSTPGNTKFHNITATTGPKEEEIVELFRKVQAQLRERAPIKEDKKIKAVQGKGEENKTVDSLLKLLRKHSVEQGKRSRSNSGNGELTNHHSAPNGDHKSTIAFKTASSLDSKEPKPQNAAGSRRPVSKFHRKSPVPQVKLQPAYTRQDAAESLHETKNERIMIEPEFENLLTNMTLVHEAASSDEENDESEIEEENDEPYRDEDVDISTLKVTELRALAKVQGLKGYSKLKKSELVKLLS